MSVDLVTGIDCALDLNSSNAGSISFIMYSSHVQSSFKNLGKLEFKYGYKNILGIRDTTCTYLPNLPIHQCLIYFEIKHYCK